MLLTYSRGKERHLFHLLAIIIHCQVPDAWVHVLDETGVMAAKGHQASWLSQSQRSVQALNPLSQESPSIQKLHKVELETERETERPRISISMTHMLPPPHHKYCGANKELKMDCCLCDSLSKICARKEVCCLLFTLEMSVKGNAVLMGKQDLNGKLKKITCYYLIVLIHYWLPNRQGLNENCVYIPQKSILALE